MTVLGLQVVIDTNVILSAVTDRDPRQRVEAERLFRAAAAGEARILLPQSCLFEVHYVLDSVYKAGLGEIEGVIADLCAMPSTRVANELDIGLWRSIWPRQIADPVDAAVVTVALAESAALCTFDRTLLRRAARFGVESWRSKRA